MTQEKIQIQTWWTSPGNKVGVVTTPDQKKWYVYATSLFPYMVVGSEILCNVNPDNKSPKGELRPTILSLVGEKPPESQPASVKPPTQKGTEFKADPDKTASIEKQTSLKSAVELCAAGKIEVDQVISFATVFAKYLSGEFVESESDLIIKYVAKYGKKGVK